MQSLRERRSHRPSPASPNYRDESPTTTPPSSKRRYANTTPSALCIAVQTLLNIIFIITIVCYYNRAPNNPSSTQHSTASSISSSTSSSASSSASSPSPSPPPVYDCHITIYSYDRPKHLHNLLSDIAREARAAEITVGVHVIDDNSYGCQYPPPTTNIYEVDHHTLDILTPVPLPQTLPCPASHRFREVEALAHTHAWKIFVSKYRHSRRRYWHLIRHAHALLRPIQAHYHLFLPDDDRLSHDFFPSITAAWHSITDARKLTLMLHVEATREHVPVWTSLPPRRLSDTVSRIGWVESGNFLCTRDLLQFLNFSFPYIAPKRWRDNPPISSGVGATLSELIHTAHKRMYRTHASYVAHVGTTLSKMNERFRKRNTAALLTKYFADGDAAYTRLLMNAATVTASIASQWEREPSLHATVTSLSPQVDHLNVYLNGYESTPPFLHAPFITVLRSDEATAHGDVGDIGKFMWCNNLTTEFHVTADDDIIYPPDYVARLLAFRQEYKAPVIVGVHGIRIRHEDLTPPNGKRSKGYYNSRDVFMATEEVAHATNVHIVGTGTMLYKVEDVGDIDIFDVFRERNMADVWFGLHMQKLRIPVMVIPHAAGWLSEVKGTFEDSIYKRSTKSRGSHRAQTVVAQSIDKWQLFPPTLIG